MSFYSVISRNYDDIFPVSIDNIEFVKHHLGQFDQPSILDIGCANGRLLAWLQDSFKQGIGIDLDKDMIGMATALYQGEKLSFVDLNMLDAQKKFEGKCFEVVSCFGNTLVHLTNSEIASFLKQAKRLLTKDGILLIQILNYDYIFENNITELPRIENEKVVFSRSYDLTFADQIVFKASLIDLETQEKVSSKITLFPIRKQKLTTFLSEAGFEEIKFYKDFKRNPFNGEHLPLIVYAK